MKRLLLAGGVTLLAYVLLADSSGRRLWNQYSSNLVRRVSYAISPAAADELFSEAFAEHRSDIIAEGRGIVSRVLADDQQGERHQRFIVKLSSGQTLLVAHNIDVSSRVQALRVGDEVEFKGEYEWSDLGGTMHWTHRDPSGQHIGGWIVHNGIRYD